MKHTKKYGNRNKQFRGERVHAVFGRNGLIGAYADEGKAREVAAHFGRKVVKLGQ